MKHFCDRPHILVGIDQLGVARSIDGQSRCELSPVLDFKEQSRHMSRDVTGTLGSQATGFPWQMVDRGNSTLMIEVGHSVSLRREFGLETTNRAQIENNSISRLVSQLLTVRRESSSRLVPNGVNQGSAKIRCQNDEDETSVSVHEFLQMIPRLGDYTNHQTAILTGSRFSQ